MLARGTISGILFVFIKRVDSERQPIYQYDEYTGHKANDRREREREREGERSGEVGRGEGGGGEGRACYLVKKSL